MAITCAAQGTYTAASASLADVKDCINGTGLNTCVKSGGGTATHTAINGDEIVVPAGTATWTAQLSFTVCIYLHGTAILNNTPGVKGVGTLSTIIYDQFNGGNAPLINYPGVAYSGCNGTTPGTFLRVSGFEIHPCLGNNSPAGVGCTAASSNIGPPINGWGIATASGAPNIRIDNINFVAFTTGHAVGPPAGNGDNSNAKIRISDFFGSVDHNTATIAVGAPGQEFINAQQANYFGVPALPTAGHGDNSWHLAWPNASSAANLNQITLEDNDLHGSATESEFPPVGMPGFGGGGRFEARFNSFNDFIGTPDLSCHGTDTAGRDRQGCKYAAYGNTHNCNGAGQCGQDLGPLDERDGLVISFGDQMATTGGPTSFQFWLDLQHQRTSRDTAFGRVGGSVYDDLDNRVDTGPWDTGTVAGSTIPVTTAPWTANAFNIPVGSAGNIWIAWDSTTGAQAFVTSNATNSVTVGGFTSIGLNGNSFTSNVTNGLRLVETTLYGSFTHTGANGAATPTSSVSYSPSQWVNSGAPYSLCDVTQGFCSTIFTNSGTAFTYDTSPVTNNSVQQLWNNGDVGVITRANPSLDDPGRAAGQLISGQVPVPFAPNATLSPSYVGLMIAPGLTASHLVKLESNQGLRYLQNRDYYNETLNQAANTGCPGACTPFTGASGVGHGTLAQMPSSCSNQTAYWATDQGSWNTSGNGFGQGALYQCQSGTFAVYWTPAPYPNPLIAASGTVTLAPSSQNFGSVNVGSSSSPVAFTVTNNSAANATSVTPSVSGNFSVSGSTCGTVTASGGTCTFNVTFSPLSTGLLSGTVTVTYAGGDGLSPQTAAVSGTGVAVAGASGALISNGTKVFGGTKVSN